MYPPALTRWVQMVLALALLSAPLYVGVGSSSGFLGLRVHKVVVRYG